MSLYNFIFHNRPQVFNIIGVEDFFIIKAENMICYFKLPFGCNTALEWLARPLFIIVVSFNNFCSNKIFKRPVLLFVTISSFIICVLSLIIYTNHVTHDESLITILVLKNNRPWHMAVSCTCIGNPPPSFSLFIHCLYQLKLLQYFFYYFEFTLWDVYIT